MRARGAVFLSVPRSQHYWFESNGEVGVRRGEEGKRGRMRGVMGWTSCPRSRPSKLHGAVLSGWKSRGRCGAQFVLFENAGGAAKVGCPEPCGGARLCARACLCHSAWGCGADSAGRGCGQCPTSAPTPLSPPLTSITTMLNVISSPSGSSSGCSRRYLVLRSPL